MTLERAVQVDTQDLSSADYELDPGAYEAYEILDFSVDGGASDSILELKHNGETLLNAQSDDGDDDVFRYEQMHQITHSIYRYLQEVDGRIPRYKVPHDSKLVFTNGNVAGTLKVIWKEFSEDQGAALGDPGTKGGLPQLMLSLGQTTESIATTATEAFDLEDSVNVSGMRDFPYEEAIPSGWEVDWLGLMVGLDDDSGADVTLDGIRAWYQEASQLGPEEEWTDPIFFEYPSASNDQVPRIFDQPISIAGPEDIDLVAQASNSSTTAAEDAVVNSCCIFLVKSKGR